MTTCLHCGFEKVHCICGKKRNSSGDVVKFNNYEDWSRDDDQYSTVGRIDRPTNREVQERKMMEELMPYNKELVTSWLKRTDKAIHAATRYGYQQHIWGTRKPWACHTTSRYCFICTMINYLDMFRHLIPTLSDLTYLEKYCFLVKSTPKGPEYQVRDLETLESGS